MKSTTTFHFYSNRTQTWEYIQQRFATDFGGIQRMVDLVKHIQSSGASARLYAYSSMDSLVVSNDELIHPRKEALHIHFDRQSQQWHFRYFAVPFKDAEFERFYPPADGINKFDQFLRWIRW